MTYRVGIDLGGTNIVAGVVDEEYRILSKAAGKTRAPRPVAEVVADMDGLYRQCVEKAGLTTDDIQSIGVGSPGVINREKGEVEHAANLAFLDAPVVPLLRQRSGKTVYMDNDANVAAYGELVAGAGRGYRDMVAITLGTGVGGGIIVGGKIWPGSYYGGAELGHMVVEKDGVPCTCGRNGCLEAYGSATGLIRMTREKMRQCPDSAMWAQCGGDVEAVDGRTAFRAADSGDEAAKQVLERYTDYLACGVANIVNILQPQLIVIGGGISKEGEKLVAPIRQKAMGVVMSRYSKQNTAITTAQLGNDAAIIGAAMLESAQ
ncbi:ROK family protein [Neobittarella massiliensis]|uniref:Glucokinase n=2 Tax=Oscillospiraceae TaxID=216572 RepID=A0A8J6LZF6_9FIRM|nr:ROK family protein [Neobittarella massiliensis]MBC3516797.1 ROK family protein [Neobittarella massiliensis]SCJ79674.1 Glucokinase [uncultured Anaerotruncus sp.]